MLDEEGIDRIAAEVGARYLPPGAVICVNSRADTGWDGDDVLRVRYVLRAEALGSVTGEQALNTLFRLQDMLRDEDEARFAVVEYATDAELALDGDP